MFLDIGIGILSSIGVSAAFGIPLSFGTVTAGILLSLGPDLDYLYHIFRRGHGENDFEHRNLLHLPLLYLPIGTAVAFLLAGPMPAVLFLVTSLAHFVHDSIGIGWGVRWLYPFSKDNIAFLYLYSQRIRQGLRQPVFVFDAESLARTVREHGDADWKRNIYGKLHPIAIVEYSVFVLSLVILLFATYVR
ncbi:MAG: hypothetical protein HGB18_04815 [Candidatus Moranbacteria bacterium]|nr:hypothetical protein [Candidatus Moranbacteria bacterium]